MLKEDLFNHITAINGIIDAIAPVNREVSLAKTKLEEAAH